MSLDLLRDPRSPRAAGYDPAWLVACDRGPNPLWLLEDLSVDLGLRPGMHVLDLGCGLGATSVFLVREFGVRVTAVDLHVPPDDVAAQTARSGVGEWVLPVRADARALPFARETFDAIVCIDAWEYFGTADGYLPYLVGFLRPGCALGVATPALRREVRELGGIPPHVRACVGGEALAWHTPEWWRFQWEATGLVEVVAARCQESGWRDWLTWTRVCAEHGDAAGAAPSLAMLEADGGELLSFALLAARRR
ncbi:cyclopropane-fatty-acyl-phospholipid synthase family protein [Pseudonocardia yuanmonensis]|uniref:Cyclopropane-fatty-acyl-phospholipid synthase family protein n=1 Tax=Pseudonocardia yuanmonensis TaxID=1095914 RepID=A0ABP8WST2_9PSEU